MPKSINGATFKKMLLSGYQTLEENKSAIDALNVFPVPDGDTGTNMSLTMRSAVKEVNACENASIEDICLACSRGALKGARGNSGVITSQIFKGLCTELSNCKEEIDIKALVKGFRKGCEVAYKAVTVPKEGTILTVIRGIADGSKEIARNEKDIVAFFEKTIIHAEKVLQQTPDMLPVLKKAGVVDAGGRGLITILTGMYKVLSGEPVSIEFVDNVTKDVTAEENHYVDDVASIEFAYCNEFFIQNMKGTTTEADIDILRERLMEIGDCVIVIGDLQQVKVHVHSNEPNKVLGYALQLGELYDVKIENMLQQNRDKRAKERENLKEMAVVAVAAGDGLASVFKDLNVDYVISGGQTMNPSANDIATAVDNVKAKNVFVLPNNKNIILAAQQANEITNANIVVIPTTSIPEGVAAALAFDPEGKVEDNTENMTQAYAGVKSGSVTYAVRDTETNGMTLAKGDIIGLDNHDIIAKSQSINDCCEQVVARLVDEDTGNITVFYGAEAKPEDVEALSASLENQYPDFDVVVANGGQPVYYYLISIE